MAAGCAHEGHTAGQHQGHPRAAEAKAATAAKAALPKPVQAVFEEYIKVQNGLAEDSIQKAKAAANSLAQAVRNDTDDALPAEISQQAQALAEALDLAAARVAFKPLSESLIKFAKSNGITPGAYVEVYCSMAKAGWLQSDKSIKNPYYGSSMLTCGQVKS
jgi:Cu(I)/Ag(I) efflux system membrane fusion protein